MRVSPWNVNSWCFALHGQNLNVLTCLLSGKGAQSRAEWHKKENPSFKRSLVCISWHSHTYSFIAGVEHILSIYLFVISQVPAKQILLFLGHIHCLLTPSCCLVCLFVSEKNWEYFITWRCDLRHSNMFPEIIVSAIWFGPRFMLEEYMRALRLVNIDLTSYTPKLGYVFCR